MTKSPYPCLWFDGQASAAADMYCSIFPNSRIIVKTPTIVFFEINGTRFTGLDGGPMFTFNESVSFIIECDNQDEIDHYWNNLTIEGEEGQCGWLKDKFGVSWQVIPSALGELMGGDPDKSARASELFMKMKKIVMDDLRNA